MRYVGIQSHTGSAFSGPAMFYVNFAIMLKGARAQKIGMKSTYLKI